MKRACLLSLALLAPLADAQTPPAAPPPRCEEAVYRQFDFWIGEWDVFNAAGAKVGSSSVTREEAGCLLVERWTSARGNNGQSYNFYDAATRKWRQVWVSPTELTDYSGALNAQGQMVLEGVSQQARGSTQRSLGTWTRNADGSVTQNFKSWDEPSRAWTEAFTGIYRRRAP